MARNRVIGARNTIPWRLPGELALFKRITMGHHILMGRNTWESINRLLPGRTTVIVTHQKNYHVEGAIVVDSLNAGIAACGDDEEIFVIGGAQLYEAALPIADRIYLTLVEADVDGDTKMPAFDMHAWKERSMTLYHADEKNPYDYKLYIYERA